VPASYMHRSRGPELTTAKRTASALATHDMARTIRAGAFIPHVRVETIMKLASGLTLMNPLGDGTHKVHFVGHSMGGNTIRMLERLIRQGDASEVAATGAGTSLLFQASKPGGNSWIQAVFTIATPHDGSTLHTKLGGNLVKFVKDLIAVFAGVMGLLPSSPDWGYNLDLEHFGLARQSGEGFWTYFDRVFSSSIFSANYRDLASWDLSPQWSREFNAAGPSAYSDTYYFAAATRQTGFCWFNDQCADLDMEALMSITANTIGDMDGVCDSGGYCFNNDWEPNDGLVPTISSRCPRVGVSGYVDPLSWSPSATSFTKGRWQTRQYNRDHVQIIGFRLNVLTWNSADGLYDDIASTIDRIRVTPGSENLINPEDQAQDNTAAIASGSALGGVALVALGVAGVVTSRRRRHKKRMVTAFSSQQPTNGFSPRKLNKKQLDRGSITLQSQVASDNPAFLSVREASSAASQVAPGRVDV
jgi:triacylglycerol esterase/lipase EstA (alpha/beta hydrolase family)